MGIKAIVFDLDGVVVDSEPLHEKVANIVLGRRGVFIKDGNINEIYRHTKGKRLPEILSYFKERFQLNDDVDELVKEVRETFFNLSHEINFMDGFKNLIEKIKPSYKTALVTSGRKPYIEGLENKIFFLKNFDCVVTGEETEHGKPSPDPYLLACKKLNIKPDEAVVIEDTPNGIVSAKAAGCTCIAVTFTFPEEELRGADYIARDFGEVGKIIEALQ